MQPTLSVVVTVYNEEENIKPLVERINNALQGLDFELIYVDDGSTDGTIRELKKLKNPPKRKRSRKMMIQKEVIE